MPETHPVADGQDHPLDPRVIPLQRITGAITFALILAGSLIGVLIFTLAADEVPWWVRLAPLSLWMAMVPACALFALLWPTRAYAHTSYRVDAQGIEIRRGVYWRVVLNVPKSRVQHIDVTQGPLERRYGLGTLAIYTAGTDHAKVSLSGLAHGRALALREHLLPSGASDAV
jgi:uncharacterized protein